MITSQNIVDFLNEAFQCDPKAIKQLVGYRCKCSKEMAQHKSIQVIGDEENPKVGLLGILNGIAALDGEVIEAKYEDKELIGFRLRVEELCS